MFNYLKLRKQLKTQRETIRAQRRLIEQLEQKNYELNNTISVLNKENDYFRRKLYGESSFGFGGFTMQKSIDYPPTKKIPDPFAFDFPGTEKSFDDFWAKFADPKNKES